MEQRQQSKSAWTGGGRRCPGFFSDASRIRTSPRPATEQNFRWARRCRQDEVTLGLKPPHGHAGRSGDLSRCRSNAADPLSQAPQASACFTGGRCVATANHFASRPSNLERHSARIPANAGQQRLGETPLRPGGLLARSIVYTSVTAAPAARIIRNITNKYLVLSSANRILLRWRRHVVRHPCRVFFRKPAGPPCRKG